MHGFVMTAIGVGRRERLEDPTPGPDDVIVAPAYSGVCGSDVHMFREGALTDPEHLPVVMGHEFVGTIVALGSNAGTVRPYGEVDRLRVGDRVAVEPLLPCGTCPSCLRGRPNLCGDWTHLGFTRNGAWADYVSVPSTRVTRLPDGVSLAQAGLAEPLACAVNFVVHRGGVAAGDVVTILGAGPVGALCVAVAKASGAGTVIVSEPVESRRKSAEVMGADILVDPTTEDLVDIVRQHSPGRLGAQVTIEATGAKQAMAQSIHVAAPGSRIVLSGIGATPDATLDAGAIVMRELSVVGGFASRWAMTGGLGLLASGAVTTDPLVSSVRHWADAETAMDDMVSDPSTCKILFAHEEGAPEISERTSR